MDPGTRRKEGSLLAQLLHRTSAIRALRKPLNMASTANDRAHKKPRYSEHGQSSHARPDESFGVQSLPVADLPHDFSGEPADGEEYLAIVRREAAAAPTISFAAYNPYAQAIADAEALPLGTSSQLQGSTDDALLMPSHEWRSVFETHFRNAREALSNPPTAPVKLSKDDLPKIGNSSAWYAWIHGRPPPPTSAEEAAKQASKAHEWRIREPSGALLLRLSTEQILGLLEAFPYWLAHRVPIPDSHGGSPDEVVQALHARWLFALLLRLDSRLVSEEISTLRTLARACVAAITLSRIRRKALRSRTKPDDSTADDDEASMRRDEAGAWMVVTIVAAVWSQSDLWHDAAADMRRVS